MPFVVWRASRITLHYGDDRQHLLIAAVSPMVTSVETNSNHARGADIRDTVKMPCHAAAMTKSEPGAAVILCDSIGIGGQPARTVSPDFHG